jgi:protein-S-isoprenylcysteine O-methyltransferase Ste14
MLRWVVVAGVIGASLLLLTEMLLQMLVTSGIYRYLRHPQYTGLILIVLGFNIQWPTIPTLVMAPILIVMYVRLARREDRELSSFFGEAFRRYAAGTPAFFPWGAGRRIFRKDAPYSVQRSNAKYMVPGARRE